MKTSRITKTIGLAFVLLLVGAAIAFGHGGWGRDDYGHKRGSGHGDKMGPAYGGHMMDDPGYGPRMRGNGGRERLTDEQIDKLEAARDKFRDETREVRGLIEEKSVALRNEIVKDEPDTGKAMEIQKEISKLKSDLDQQKLQHRLEIKKIVPEASQERGRGYGRRGGRGGGYGYCR